MENFDWTPIITAIISLIGVVITVYVIPWLKTKTTNEQWSIITTWAKIFVNAAEVIFIGDNTGKEKHEYVLDLLIEKCKELKINVDVKQLDAVLEDAWKDMVDAATPKQLTTIL